MNARKRVPSGELDDKTLAQLELADMSSTPQVASNERAAEPKGSAPGASGARPER